MAIFTSILTAGTNNHQTTAEELNRFMTDFIAPGVVGSISNTAGVAPMTGNLSVNAAGTPNKTTTIGTGNAVIAATPATQGSQNLGIRNASAVVYTHPDNNSGATVYDYIYLSVDPVAANNPSTDGSNVTSVIVNRSTSAVTDTVGAPTYKLLLAVVTLVNGFTTITNGNIADKRVASSAALPDGGVTASKISAGAIDGSKLNATLLGAAASPFRVKLPVVTAHTPGYTGSGPQIVSQSWVYLDPADWAIPGKTTKMRIWSKAGKNVGGDTIIHSLYVPSTSTTLVESWTTGANSTTILPGGDTTNVYMRSQEVNFPASAVAAYARTHNGTSTTNGMTVAYFFVEIYWV